MILKPWEVEYIVAPVDDSTGVVGLVSEAYKMPYPAYAGSLPPIPHTVDAYKAGVHHVGPDRDERAAVGWGIYLEEGEYKDPKTGEDEIGGYAVVDSWERVWIVRGDIAFDKDRTGWSQKVLDEDTYTVSHVAAGEAGGHQRSDTPIPPHFNVVEVDRFERRIGYNRTEGGDSRSAWRDNLATPVTVVRMKRNSQGKLFPRGGYTISWPWNLVDGSVPDRWVVYRRDNDLFGFVGHTTTNVNGRASFTDEGIPPDLAQGPPVRSKEGAAYEVVRTERQGWPGVSGRYAQRTIMGGYEKAPAELKFASPGPRLDFFTSTPTQDTDTFVRELDSRHGTEIRHLVESSGLLALTSSGEWSVGSGSGTLTPSTAQALAVGYIGCSHVPPLVLDDRVVFVNRPGTRIYAVQQEQELGRLDVGELTTLARTVFNDESGVPQGIRAMAWSSDERMILILIKDKLIACTYLPEANVVAFSEHQTDLAEGQVVELIDIAVIRRVSASNQQYRDHAYIAAKVDGVLRVLRLPMRTIAGQPEQQGDKLAGDAEDIPVVGRVETFSFSPQSRHGRDEGDDPAYASEWFTGMARAFVEATCAGLKVDVRPGLAAPKWPLASRVSTDRVTSFGDFQPAHDPSVVVEYAGEQRAEVLGVGVTDERDDPSQGGLPVLILGNAALWVPPDQRTVLMRDPQSGDLVNVLDAQAEVVTRGGRHIRDWAYAEHSKLLFLVMSDGTLVACTSTGDGLAWTEHLVAGYAARNVAVLRVEDLTGVTEMAYLVMRSAATRAEYVARLPLEPQGGARDGAQRQRVARFDLTPEKESSYGVL